MKCSRLKEEIAMFSLGSSKLKSAIVYGLFIFAIDSFLIFNRIQKVLDFQASIKQKNYEVFAGVWEVLISHSILIIGQIAFCHLVLVAFDIKKKLYFYLVLSFYMFLFAVIHLPQLFQSSPFSILPADRSYFSAELFISMCVLVSAFVCLKANKVIRGVSSIFKKSLVSLTSIIIFSFIILNCLSLLGDHFPYKSSQISSSRSTNKKSIIVISTDALNADVDTILYKFSNGSFRKFLDISKFSRSTISDTSQSSEAFAALFSDLRPYQSRAQQVLNPNLVDFKTLQQIKNQGYQIGVVAGDTPTESLSRQPGQPSKFSQIYSSILTYGIFDNKIGHFLFPSAYRNSNYLFGKDPSFAAERFIEYLNTKENSANYEFIYIHSDVLRSPLFLPYPYYPKKGKGEIEGVRYSYPSPFFSWRLDQREALQAEAKWNAEIYEAGVRYLVEQFLNPVFESLEKQKYFEDSTVFLISSYGENLWNLHQKTIANIAIPSDGDTLLFGSKAEFSYFRVLNPINKDFDSEKEINLSQNFRKALGLTFDESMVYSETVYAPLRESSSLIHGLEIPPAFQKQRSVFGEGFKFTYYPTITGPKFFMCEYKRDSFCYKNYFNEKSVSEVQVKLLKQLSKVNNSEAVRGFSIPLETKVSNFETLTEIKKNLNSKNEWTQYLAAENLYFHFHDFKTAERHIQEIFGQTKNLELKSLISKTILRRCLFADEKTKLFYRQASKFVEDDLEFPFAFRWRLELLDCIKSDYDFNEGVASPMAIRWKFDSILSLKTTWNLPEAIEYLDGLKQRYRLAESQRISDIFRNIPLESRVSEGLKFMEFVKDRFSYFFAYDLTEETQAYYFIKFIVYDASGIEIPKIFLKEISNQPGGTDFESRLFSYLEKQYKLPALTYGLSPQDRRTLRLNRLKKVVGI